MVLKNIGQIFSRIFRVILVNIMDTLLYDKVPDNLYLLSDKRGSEFKFNVSLWKFRFQKRID